VSLVCVVYGAFQVQSNLNQSQYVTTLWNNSG